MKTFFTALILGIFVGLFINNYFADPEAYTKIKEAKESLFDDGETEELEVTEPELPIEQTSEPAMFEVASKELNAAPESATSLEDTKPEPLPKPEPLNPAPEPEEEPPAEVEAPDVTPAEEPPLTNKQKAEKLVEEGVEKAAEIAETVKEKVKEASEEAKPQIEQGIVTGIDATLALAIRGQYKLEKRLDASKIEVAVKNRIAILSGQAADEETKQLAIEIAVFTKGVNGVEESLEVAP